jgi:hypothetical protein
VLAKWWFREAGVLFPAILFGMFIPYQSVLVPLVQTLQRMGLYGTLPGLIFVRTGYGIPITTLIFRNYYATIPTELVEAGTMDGAGLWGIYQRIIVPLSPPAFVVAAIWQFTSIWNDFVFGVTVTSQPGVQPITVALNNLAGSFVVEWNVQMGGAARRASDGARLRPAGPVLHAGVDGRVAQGVTQKRWRGAECQLLGEVQRASGVQEEVQHRCQQPPRPDGPDPADSPHEDPANDIRGIVHTGDDARGTDENSPDNAECPPGWFAS